ncbi:MAG: tRNA-intron lyase [Candidatus Aenigmatarchaeota archaeon]|nr:MAG: tRNA-intron lyase [Candidatus Aenigmarchaeota archaeon]
MAETEQPVKQFEGVLEGTDVIVWGEREAEEVYDIGCYGKSEGGQNTLALVEAMHLVERKRLLVREGKTKLDKEEFHARASELDKEFAQKYKVFKDLRERGFVVRTGFKFGTHFRVYDRGVKLKKGPKSAKEHTKWIVHAVPEGFTCSYAELSRAVRLAHNIRATMLWAVVDDEGDVTYYHVTRITP